MVEVVEWHLIVVLKQKHGLPTLTHKLQWPDGPRTVEVVLQSVFVCEAIDAARRRMLQRGKHGQEFVPGDISAYSPDLAIDAITVLPQHLGSAVLTTIIEPRRCVHASLSRVDTPELLQNPFSENLSLLYRRNLLWLSFRSSSWPLISYNDEPIE
jgi:hypothetical protein